MNQSESFEETYSNYISSSDASQIDSINYN
jgi:hypothetical protein